MSKITRFVRIVNNHFKEKDFPSRANYEITQRCNLKCEHCYLNKNSYVKKELSDKEWEKVFLEHRKKGISSVHLTGGEPALRLDVIRSANKIFKAVSIVSNGTIKIPEEIQRRIFVSIDGPEEIHNKIRGVKIFNKIMKIIKDDKRVILTPTLSTTNYKYIEDLINITRESNVEGITFSTYTSFKQDKDFLLLKEDELDWTVDKLKEIWKKNKDIVFLSPSIIKLFKTKKHYKNCFFKGNDFISFDPNLNVKKPCVMGKNVNCKTCGCIVPIIGYTLTRFDIRSWFILDKIFPERYGY